MKKILMSLTMITCLFIASCSSDDDNSSSGKKQAVVTFLKNSSIDYWKQIESAINAECKTKNYQSFVYYVKDDSDIDGQFKAVSGISELQKNYDIKGIILAPIYTDGNHKVEQALANYVGDKIPVIILDSPVDENNNPLKNSIKAYVGTDNYTAGQRMAEAITADSSTIFAARIKNSTPTTARYEGFCKVIGQEVPIWETENDLESPESLTKKLSQYPNAQNLVFFNGNLCISVLEACNGKNVYSFDAYKPLFEDMINNNGCVKGIITQNTFQMGQLAVSAITDPNAKGNIYVTTIYISRETIYSNAVRPFMEYFGMNGK